MRKNPLLHSPTITRYDFDTMKSGSTDITYTSAYSSVITVNRRKEWTPKGDGQHQTSINWSAMGAVSIVEAEAMLAALKMAITVAQQLEASSNDDFYPVQYAGDTAVTVLDDSPARDTGIDTSAPRRATVDDVSELLGETRRYFMSSAQIEIEDYTEKRQGAADELAEKLFWHGLSAESYQDIAYAAGRVDDNFYNDYMRGDASDVCAWKHVDDKSAVLLAWLDKWVAAGWPSYMLPGDDDEDDDTDPTGTGVPLPDVPPAGDGSSTVPVMAANSAKIIDPYELISDLLLPVPDDEYEYRVYGGGYDFSDYDLIV